MEQAHMGHNKRWDNVGGGGQYYWVPEEYRFNVKKYHFDAQKINKMLFGHIYYLTIYI